jgi:oxaloacetate decarboxylase beta subunit
VLDQVIALLNALLAQAGMAQFSFGNLVMIAAGAGMIALAAIRRYEPLLLVGVGFACIVANVPAAGESSLFHYAYLGMDKLILPSLLALGVGAMTDFGPVIGNPRLLILGAGAQFGIAAALVLAKAFGFSLKEAGAIGIIGGADGPLAIFVSAQLAPHLLGAVSVTAFSFLALMSTMQQRMMRTLTGEERRAAGMATLRQATKLEKIAFPIFMAIAFNLFFPPIAPLITMLMLGNLLREVESAGRLAKTAAGSITNAVIIVLTVAIGSAMAADKFLTVQTVEIVLLGLAGFVCCAASTMGMAKLMNLLFGMPADPLTPIATRAYQLAAEEEHPETAPIHSILGPDLSGVFGAAILGGIMLVAFSAQCADCSAMGLNVPDTLSGALVFGISAFALAFASAALIGLVLAAFPLLNRIGSAPAAKTLHRQAAAPAQEQGEIAEDYHVAAISAAVAAMIGPHRIVHIEPLHHGLGWQAEGRSRHHGSHAAAHHGSHAVSHPGAHNHTGNNHGTEVQNYGRRPTV